MSDCRSLIGTVCAVCLSAFAARAETFVDYPAGAATAGDSQSFTLVPVSTGRKHDLQPLGRDGWRRVDGHGRAFVSVIRGGDSPREQVWLDNIKVLSGDFASGEAVYTNDFDTRIRK